MKWIKNINHDILQRQRLTEPTKAKVWMYGIKKKKKCRIICIHKKGNNSSTGTHLCCRKSVWQFIWFLWNPLPLLQTPENLHKISGGKKETLHHTEHSHEGWDKSPNYIPTQRRGSSSHERCPIEHSESAWVPQTPHGWCSHKPGQRGRIHPVLWPPEPPCAASCCRWVQSIQIVTHILLKKYYHINSCDKCIFLCPTYSLGGHACHDQCSHGLKQRWRKSNSLIITNFCAYILHIIKEQDITSVLSCFYTILHSVCSARPWCARPCVFCVLVLPLTHP